MSGAGLVYICNPNNPTATTNSAKEITEFIAAVKKASPTTGILIDEAYIDYATDPGVQTAIPQALTTPGVIVARTFSKAYGMAGVRIGYAIGDAATIKKMSAWRMPYNVNTFGVAAAVASLKDPQHIKDESARNKAVREFTVKALADMGYTATDSQTNFIFVDIGKTMTAAAFRDACAAKRRDGRPRLPAARKTVGAYLARHDGRNAEGHRGVPQRAQVFGDDLVGEGQCSHGAYATKLCSDRRNRSGRGPGAAACGAAAVKIVSGPLSSRTSRPSSGTSSASRATKTRSDRARKCSTRVRALLEGGAKPGRYSNQAGELTEAIAAHFKVKPDNVLVSEGSTEILRAATQVFTAKTKPLVGTIPTYEECAGYAGVDGQPGEGRQAQRRVQDRPRRVLARLQGRGAGVLLQPEQPDRDLCRREGDARLHSRS